MLSRRPVAVTDSKDRKLFNLLVSHYLNCQSIETFSISEDLLPSVPAVNTSLLVGTNYITYDPQLVFSASDLIKLNALKDQINQIESEIALKKKILGIELDSEIISAHKTYMSRLHRYNEAKDIAQALIGKLAQITGKTTKDLYPDFNLSLED